MNAIRLGQNVPPTGYARAPIDESIGKNYRRLVRNLFGLPETLGKTGNLELRFAVTKKEIAGAQRLRWQIFYEHGCARPDPLTRLHRRDICAFDAICDHLIVVDHAATGRRGQLKPRVVGTYRLLRQDIADAHNGFYSSSEFDVDGLLSRHTDKTFLELGRSCILPQYRSKRVLELLWRGIWHYALHHRIDAMIGCASLPGTDPAVQAPVLSHISRLATATGDWSVPPLPGRNLAIAGYCAEHEDIEKRACQIPPLVKGYLRLGARFGEGLFIDHKFGTTDIFVVLPIADIDRRYIEYFSAPLATSSKSAAYVPLLREI